MTAAIVLCAGFGTRLAPLTDGLPKPLMPVGDRPALAHVAAALAKAGVARLVANTHHRAADFVLQLARIPTELHLVHEARILGTAGGVANASAALGDGEVVVWNGDIVAPSLDVAAVLLAYQRARAEALWVVEPAPLGSGTVGLDDAGCVVRVRGERFGEETAGGEFLGIQVIGAELRRVLPGEGCLVGDVALPLLRRGGRIASFAYRGAWDDIGHPAWLLRANLRWLEQRGLPAWSAEGASVDPGVDLHRSLVGDGATVRGKGALRATVVFPGAAAVAPSSRVLVAPHASLAVERDLSPA